MRKDFVVVLALGILPTFAHAAEKRVPRSSETQVEQLDPKLTVHPRAQSSSSEPSATEARPQPGQSVRCTPDNATSPECATAAARGR